MGGSEGESRVSAVGSDASLCFLRNWRSGVLEKKNAIANQYEWTAFGREMAPRSGPTNIRDPNRTPDPNCRRVKQIKRARVFCENASEIQFVSTLLCRRARPRMRDAGGTLSENQKSSPETRIRKSTSC